MIQKANMFWKACVMTSKPTCKVLGYRKAIVWSLRKRALEPESWLWHLPPSASCASLGKINHLSGSDFLLCVTEITTPALSGCLGELNEPITYEVLSPEAGALCVLSLFAASSVFQVALGLPPAKPLPSEVASHALTSILWRWQESDKTSHTVRGMFSQETGLRLCTGLLTVVTDSKESKMGPEMVGFSNYLGIREVLLSWISSCLWILPQLCKCSLTQVLSGRVAHPLLTLTSVLIIF